MQTWTLFVPVAQNEQINSNHRIHYHKRAGTTRVLRQRAHTLAEANNAPALLPRVEVNAYIIRPNNRRYDPGNLYPTAKAIVDGLVDAGLVEDDDWRHLEGPFMRHGGINPDTPGIRLEIKELPA